MSKEPFEFGRKIAYRTTGSDYLKRNGMPIIFSRACEYAFQAVLYLASQPQDRPVLQRDISRALQIPPHFLGKVLQSLSRNSLVISRKGKSGGFILGRSPKDISLFDILEATDGATSLDGCILGFSECGDENPCPVHFQWKQSKQILLEMLRNKNAEELSREIKVKLQPLKEQEKEPLSHFS